MQKRVIVGLCFGMLFGCSHTPPGTHVELVEKGGEVTFVGGAVAPGMNQKTACRGAINRAAHAIGEKFSDKHDDIGDKVAEEIGAANGHSILYRYARKQVLDAAVQDITFEPDRHRCMATISWKPPLFLEKSVMEFARQLQQGAVGAADVDQGGQSASVTTTDDDHEIAEAATGQGQAMGAEAGTNSAIGPRSHTNDGAKQGPTKRCPAQRKQVARVRSDARQHVNRLQECLDRTEGDETACHRYVLYVERGEKQEAEAPKELAACFHGSLPVGVQKATALDWTNFMVLRSPSDDVEGDYWAYGLKSGEAVELVYRDGRLDKIRSLDESERKHLKIQLGL